MPKKCSKDHKLPKKCSKTKVAQKLLERPKVAKKLPSNLCKSLTENEAGKIRPVAINRDFACDGDQLLARSDFLDLHTRIWDIAPAIKKKTESSN